MQNIYYRINPRGRFIKSRAAKGFESLFFDLFDIQIFDLNKCFDMIRCKAKRDENNGFVCMIANGLAEFVGIGFQPLFWPEFGLVGE